MISFEEFEEKYEPITNVLSSEADNKTFETYGRELEYVMKQDNKCVWTAVYVSNENTYILPGKHFVDRAYYYVCKLPWEDENEKVNDNEMISMEDSVDACLNFFKELGFILDRYNVKSYFLEEFTDQTEITIGDAKYTAIDYWKSVDNELTGEEDDLIHEFYSNLI
jgi:hypothetical protein